MKTSSYLKQTINLLQFRINKAAKSYAVNWFFCPVYCVAPPPPRKTRADLIKNINADYYGYRDEDDGILIPMEQEKQKKSMSDVDTLVRKSLKYHSWSLFWKFITVYYLERICWEDSLLCIFMFCPNIYGY